jgi:hypothetical protein
MGANKVRARLGTAIGLVGTSIEERGYLEHAPRV